MKKIVLSVMPALLMLRHVGARSWRDVETLHGLEPPLPFDLNQLFSSTDPLNTPSPTGPTSAPTVPATSQPTVSPTLVPTLVPTTSPTTAPTFSPPTSSPTSSPTDVPDPYPFNEPPNNPDPWYFNYDTRPDALYGPGHPGIVPNNDGFTVNFKNNGWTAVSNPPDSYWREFDDNGFGPWKGTLANHIPERNRCHRVGMQSPIDVFHNNLGVCHEHHEVRSLPGDFRITGDKVTKKIESNKLRLIFNRRPCGDLRNVACQGKNTKRTILICQNTMNFDSSHIPDNNSLPQKYRTRSSKCGFPGGMGWLCRRYARGFQDPQRAHNQWKTI